MERDDVSGSTISATTSAAAAAAADTTTTDAAITATPIATATEASDCLCSECNTLQ